MPLVTGTCANCSRERLLKYARRTMCATYACQRAAAAEVAARKAGSRGDSERESKAPPVFCYEILLVNGQRDFDPANLVGKGEGNEGGEDEFIDLLGSATSRRPHVQVADIRCHAVPRVWRAVIASV